MTPSVGQKKGYRKIACPVICWHLQKPDVLEGWAYDFVLVSAVAMNTVGTTVTTGSGGSMQAVAVGNMMEKRPR